MDINNLCLGALCLGDASGYEIKKLFESSFSHFQAASFGSIYPALARLTEQGMVNYREETQDKRPTKKVFSITDAGREHFYHSLATTEPAEQYRSDFLVLMMFAHLLPGERVAQILQTQTDNVEQELETLRGYLDCAELTVGMRFTIEYGIAANQALLQLLRDRYASLLEDHQSEQDRHQQENPT